MLEAPNLESLLDQATSRYLDGSPTQLSESIRYSLLAPGKRIRPRLALAASQMLGLAPKAALPPALAVEMIHCFTLIHDDLPCMDNDDFRRGKPSNHKVYGESMALLAGDALLTMAFEVLTEAAPHLSQSGFVAGLQRLLYCAGPRGVAGGQALEMTLGEHARLDRLEEVHRAKTGALFEAAILVPMDFAGVASTSQEGSAISEFARALGSSFQVADDIEDLTQDSRTQNAPPSNILHYKSAAEVMTHSANRLRKSCDTLAVRYGAEAGALLTIAQEVLKKLTV